MLQEMFLLLVGTGFTLISNTQREDAIDRVVELKVHQASENAMVSKGKQIF